MPCSKYLWCLLVSHLCRAHAAPTGLDDQISSQPSQPFPQPPAYYSRVRTAHAALAAVAWLIFFPLGGILVRVIDNWKVELHSVVQMAGYVVFVAGAGCGIWMARTIDVLDRYHPIIGIILLGCLALQPLTELINHWFYRAWPKTIYLGHFHLWFGRLLITIGIVQGGLGFVFADSLSASSRASESGARIAYGVVATTVWILYISLAVVWPEAKPTFGWWRRWDGRQRRGGGEGLRNLSLSDAAAPSAINRPLAR